MDIRILSDGVATGSSACNLAAVCAGQLDIYWYVMTGETVLATTIADQAGTLAVGHGISAWVLLLEVTTNARPARVY